MKAELAVGLMSGTSADGLTITLTKIDISGKKIEVLKYKNYVYPANLRLKILSAFKMKVPEISELNFKIGRLQASCARRFFNECRMPLRKISVIGSHGQTVYHAPFSKTPSTMQIGEASFLVQELGVPVVFDFRSADICAGGQGAPLVPFLDEFLFAGSKKRRLLLNIGGIANFSVVGGSVKTFGFDCGPGNCLMDDFMLFATKGRKHYDKNGKLAAAGRIDFKRAEKMLQNTPYFFRRPPKSLERSFFSMRFIRRFFDVRKEKAENIMATLNYFTALVVRRSRDRFVKGEVKEIVISGGGVFNKTLMDNFRKVFSGIKVASIDEYGINPLAKEAACFALLGLLTLRKRNNHPFYATGAKRNVALGKIVFPAAGLRGKK